LPFLSFKEYGGNSKDILQYLIDSCPGRSDLFETYAAQGLPLTGQICGDKRTPIDYAVCNFKKLSKKHGVDTIYNLIHLLHKLGANVDEYSGDGTYPLINAYNAKNDDLVKLLLGLGANENQYRVDKERIDEQERKKQEQREKKERIKLAKENFEKTKLKKGIILQACLSVVYLFLLWGTDIIRAPWEGGFTFLRCLPLIIFSLITGMICIIFFREADGDELAGILLILLLVVMILVQSITICVWRGDVGILLVYLIGRIIINTLCAVPGAIFIFLAMDL